MSQSHRRYTVLETLGSGAQGDAVLVEYLDEPRFAVIKTVWSEKAARREAAIGAVLAKIAQPTPMFAFARTLDPHRLSSDYLSGPSVYDCLHDPDGDRWFRALVPTEADWWRLLALLAQPIQVLHRHDVIHSDISTKNVILATDDRRRVRPVLIDFGMASVGGRDVHNVGSWSPDRVRRYNPRMARGTKGYDRKEDDVYALGALLFRLVERFNGPERVRVLVEAVLMAGDAAADAFTNGLQDNTLGGATARYAAAREQLLDPQWGASPLLLDTAKQQKTLTIDQVVVCCRDELGRHGEK